MRLRSSLPRFILIATVCAFIVGLAACTGSAETGPRAWIDFPRDGSTIPTGTFVTIVSHGFAEEGVADLQLSVNGEEYRRVSPEEPGATFCEVRQEWLPEEAGLYTLQVRTYDTAGAVSSPHGITLRVVDEIAAEPTGIPPATVTAVPSPTEPTTSTATPDETPTASATPTPIPPVATFTPTPVQPTPTFTALPPTPTLTPVPPTPTFTPIPPTPTLTPSPTIPPPDTSPPPAPIPMVPADGLALSCRTSQTLAWLPVEDPSGITGYYIRLERQVITNQWDLVREWGPVPDKQTVVEDLQCAVFYRWAVRAMDGAGNLSDWSEWSHFSLLLD